MAIAEPDNELYAAVRPVANVWPPDDEDAVTELADNWRKAGKLAGQAGTELADQRQASEHAWRDQAGKAMGQKVAGHAITLQEQQHAEQVAQLGDRYAQALKDVKSAIVTAIAIAINLPDYLYLSNPKFGAAGKARQQALVVKIASALQALVAAKTKDLQAPPPVPDTDTLLGKAADVSSMVATGAGLLALVPGVDLVAVPIAALAGATALTLHAVDMIDTHSYDDPQSWAGIGGDAIGLLPGGRAVGEVTNETYKVTKSAVANSAVDTVLQVPSAIDLSTNDDTVDTLKDAAGDVGLAKGLYQEGPRMFRMLHR